MKTIVLAAALAVASTAAFAQATTATQYYVVQDTAAKKCMVVTTKPQPGGSRPSAHPHCADLAAHCATKHRGGRGLRTGRRPHSPMIFTRTRFLRLPSNS